jgi:hypothetical protein
MGTGIGRNRSSGVRRCPTFDRTAAALVVYVGYGTQCKTFDRTTAALVVYPVLIALWYNSRCVARVCGLMGARARIQLLNAQLESSESAIILCLCFVWGGSEGRGGHWNHHAPHQCVHPVLLALSAVSNACGGLIKSSVVAPRARHVFWRMNKHYLSLHAFHHYFCLHIEMYS